LRLIETATNRRPVSAAAAPAEATAKSAQSSSWYALTAGLSRIGARQGDAACRPEHAKSDEPGECHRSDLVDLAFGLAGLAVFGGRAATWLIAVLTQLAASFGCLDQLRGKAR
jgi:hypothetical protein